MLIAALVLYLPITWIWILLPTRRPAVVSGEGDSGTRLAPPRWAVVLALLAAAVVPNAAFAAVSEAGRAQPFVTWVIGGIGALMTVVMVRRRPIVAWVGTGILAGSAAAWLGRLARCGMASPARSLGLTRSCDQC